MSWFCRYSSNSATLPKTRYYVFACCILLITMNVLFCFKKTEKIMLNSYKNVNRIEIAFYNKEIGYIPKRPFYGCENKCLESKNNYTKNKFVVFLGVTIGLYPPRKTKGQVWIYYSHEAPFIRVQNTSKYWKNVFNWTVSVRRDSDLFYGYGGFTKHSKPLTSTESILKYNKSDLKFFTKPFKSAWVVSNCKTQSKRKMIVKLLEKEGIHKIDIFGRCGKLKCTNNCFDKIFENYPFYLSFENSICRDYVTEKAFNFLNASTNIIPVVRGHKASYKKLLPPQSYVNVNDFKSVNELNEYLEDIVSDQAKYAYFLSWKKFYQLAREEKIFCKLCHFVHSKVEKKEQRLYENIELWFKGDQSKPICLEPDDV